MKKLISFLLILVVLFSACCNVFADGDLTPEKVKNDVLTYYDNNEAAIKDALISAAGEYASFIDSIDVRASVSRYLDTNGVAVCAYINDICQSTDGREAKTASIANFIAGALIELFNTMMPGGGDMLADNIRNFANSYAPTIAEQYKAQLNIATIMSSGNMFFFLLSFIELAAIICLIIALGRSKKAAKPQNSI